MTLKKFKETLQAGCKLKLVKAETKTPASSKLAGTTQIAPNGEALIIDRDGWYNQPNHKQLGQIKQLSNYGKVDLVFVTESGDLSYLSAPKVGEVEATKDGFRVKKCGEGYGTRLQYSII